MRYGIIGMGPVGAVMASMLKADGNSISVFDIDSHRIELLKSAQIKITGLVEAEAYLDQVYNVFSDFVATDPDVVLVAVKTYSLKDVVDRIAHSSLKTKIVVSCQNGIDTEKDIAKALGEEHAFRMILNFGVNYSTSNEVRVSFLNTPHYVSAVSPKQGNVARQLADDFSKAGFETEYTEDLAHASFKKAILNATLGSICSLTRLRMAEVMKDPELLRMVKEIIREGIRICKASDVAIEDDFFDTALAYLGRGGNHKPSMLIDIESARPTEIGHLTGKLFEYAEKNDLEVPVMQTLFYLVKSLEKAQMNSAFIHSSYE